MRRITIVRHAKSSWDNPTLMDAQRPLNARGKDSAPMMGERLRKRGMSPDLLVSSPASRAVETAHIIAGKLGYPQESIHQDSRLYHASVKDWFSVICSFPKDANHVLCFGHNPGLTHLYNIFSPEPQSNIPTCGIIDLTFDVDEWEDVTQAKPGFISYDYPKSKELETIVCELAS
jgi:phosphohistidine phosphatase